MAKDRDELTRDAEELEAQLDAELEKGENEDRLRGGRDAAEARAARAGARALRHLEERKDSPEAMSEAISQRYLTLGQQLLSDPGGVRRLPKSMRDRVSKLIGRDPGDVRIHTGERAQQAADALGARAFAVGDGDIYFGRGEFRPETQEGMGVLVHELTHVADQQMQGAAFSVAEGGAAGAESGSEGRARRAESFALDSGEEQDQIGDGEEGLSEEDIDLEKLEETVIRLIQASESQAADRTGASGHVLPR